MTWKDIIQKDLRQQAKEMKYTNKPPAKSLREQGSKYKEMQERKRNPPKHGSPEQLEEINQQLRDKGLNV